VCCSLIQAFAKRQAQGSAMSIRYDRDQIDGWATAGVGQNYGEG